MRHENSDRHKIGLLSAYVILIVTESKLETRIAITCCIQSFSSQQQVSCLCLLDLSAAFDTIDLSILLESLSSWFGISGTALNRVKSYLTSRSFFVQVRDSQSSVYQLLYGVPQGSVLGPLLFILYTSPLSTIISKSSVHHHLYADDTYSFSFLFLLINSVKMCLFLKMQLLKSPHGCLQIFSCLTPQKLNSYL
jgi:Reverse transcriptase (RNA-dependent DNA polymerase)